MKQKLTLLLTALLLGLNTMTALGQNNYEKVIADPTDWTGEYLLVYENDTNSAYCWNGVDLTNCYTELTINGNTIIATNTVTISVEAMEGGYSIQVNGGSNDGKYIYGLSSNNAIKFGDSPSLNTLTFETDWVKITSNSSVIRFNKTSGQLRFRYFKSDTYTSQQPVQLYKKNNGSQQQETVATPTFDPAAGTYYESQSVSLNCATDGAVIRYTLDGSDPTESSTEYSTALNISETTTVKAKAWKEGYEASDIASAEYIIVSQVTILEARLLDNDEYALVQGVVNFIDGRNVHIQDSTAAIDLFLLSGTVPSSLSTGDMVQACGKKTVYKGLIQLTEIDGNNPNVFTVLSSGHDLPLAIQTIAEINEDLSGSNLLQSTRVKIENATIGPINPNGTTVISQDGNALNIYRIPVVEGMIEGDWVTVTGVISCYNTPQLLIANANDITFTHRPVLTANPTTVTGMTYEYEEGGPSQVVSFLLSGNYLNHNVSIYPSESFEVSTYPSNQFRPENPAIIYSPHSGYFYDLNISVRLKAGLEAGAYNEQLVVVSEGADTLFVNVSGNVTGNDPTPPISGDYVRISSLDEISEGSRIVFAARFNENAANYYAMTNASSGKPIGVLFTSIPTTDENEILPASIVDEESNYYWTVGVTANGYTFTNASSKLIGYSSGTNFTTGGNNTVWTIEKNTASNAGMVPEYIGFLITNANVTDRAFALNNNYNFGPYSTSNIGGSQAGSYNFFLDIFVKTEGSNTPVVAIPTFTPAAGTYYEAQTVSIACATEGATIHYTLDGSNPTEASPVYSTPLTISETTTVKAIAMKDGYDNSAVAEATYTIQLGVVIIFNQDWEDEMNGWTFVDVEGEASWSISSYSGNHFAKISGHNKGANTDWCISPAFNLDDYDNPVLSFLTATKYDGNAIEVFFSNNYDGQNPTTATWTPLSCALSQGDFEWAESGHIDLSSFAGTNCHIGFKYTCTATQAATWEVDDIMLIGQTSAPVITVTPLTLTGFSYIEGSGPSAEQSFTVSALNLSDNVTVTEADNYEISLGSGNNFNAQTTLTLSQSNGTIDAITIYVRLKSGLAVGEYNDENIAITSADLDEIQVTCSGSVTEMPIPGNDYVRISEVGQLVAGNRVILAARYNTTSNAYRAAANTLSGGKLNTTEFTSVMNGGNEIIPADIISNESDHYWTVGITSEGYTFTNANGDMIAYGSNANFTMNGNNTAWNIEAGVTPPESLVPEYYGFNIINTTTNSRCFALRVTTSSSVIGPYSINNMTNGEYNFSLDIFMQGEGGTPTVATPTFTPAAGTYYEAQTVSIACATGDATIHYTLDGSNPTGTSPVYSTPLTISETTTVKAIAMKDGYNNSAVAEATYTIQLGVVIIFNQDWEDDWNGWTEVIETGDSLWRIASYGGNHYAYANGFNHDVSTTDWLISPAFNLDSYSDVVLTFRTAMNYTGPDLEVFFSNNYDGQNPAAATWSPLTCTLSTGNWTWIESGDISLDDFTGSNCYIGFKYTCTDTEAAGWEVDDIMLVSGTNTNPTITATPIIINGLEYLEGSGPSASQTYTLTATNLEGAGNITVNASEGFEISLENEAFVGQLSIAFADGQIVNQPVTVYVRMAEGLEAGTYEGTITHTGGGATTEVSLAGTVHGENDPFLFVYMPQYIQGNNGSNNNRVPVAIIGVFENLEPNTTYRYTNQLVDGNDGPETAGAGNVIYVNEEGFYRSTSPSLATEGGYGVFTTTEDGEAFVWLMNEPTANSRFTPGNHVFLRVRINDGQDGTTVHQAFTSQDYATVLNFGNEHNAYQGSAFYAKSEESPMSFAIMFSADEDERPIYSTSIESVGVDYGNINQYADFYKELVAGQDGWFGGILPNDNEEGINAIWILDIYGEVANEFYTEEGLWLPEAITINPTNGLDTPIFIDLTYDGVEEPFAANVKIWSADHEFVIENGEATHYNMTVFNILGQPMMKQQINAGSTKRIGHNLATGVYVISLQNNENIVSMKVIVR